ncbi:FecR domain-containing protein [Flavitalea sp. BT771]|uniref:FecR family protein n=1 Tax=Flavitalea sp. BT771 TaxID=3063329 RepID=UPI0026E158AF|nr:FecR domain-containing protein [Flavitalea sp. BT771]MDO6432791.1 FecR domain-containing protein [Flavitalea sp. BT771]MDV6221933.1 FecR domain-containing protein [Flavitalea sp. BT771]
MTIQHLFARYLDESISPEELLQLHAMIKAGYDEGALDGILEGAFSDPAFAGSAGDHDKKEIFASLLARIDSKEKEPASPAPVVRLYPWRWKAIGAAALVLLLAGGIYLSRSGKGGGGELAGGRSLARIDAPPGRSGAMLTLSDGRQVQLDSVQDGLLEKEGNVSLRKEEGQIIYGGKAAGDAVLYNTITTPRGRQFRLVLADGTQVMLNAASSIRYPTVFAGRERRVVVSGEAYFEVAQDRNSPFIVQLGRGEVQVLGTHFDVADYDDEDNINATLLEGSVRLKAEAGAVALTPGRQGKIDRSTGKLSVRQVDTAAVTAWVRGRMDIGNTDFAALMRQISRWYDVDIAFTDKVPAVRIGGVLHRDVNLATVLGFLEDNGVHYTMKGKTILISP